MVQALPVPQALKQFLCVVVLAFRFFHLFLKTFFIPRPEKESKTPVRTVKVDDSTARENQSKPNSL